MVQCGKKPKKNTWKTFVKHLKKSRGHGNKRSSQVRKCKVKQDTGGQKHKNKTVKPKTTFQYLHSRNLFINVNIGLGLDNGQYLFISSSLQFLSPLWMCCRLSPPQATCWTAYQYGRQGFGVGPSLTDLGWTSTKLIRLKIIHYCGYKNDLFIIVLELKVKVNLK